MSDRELTPEALADDEAKRGFDRPKVDDSVYEPFNPGQLKFAVGHDGLAGVQLTQGDVPVAPPLTPDTLVCMADTSSFVIRGEWGDVLVSFRPEEVTRAPDGRWFVTVNQVRMRFASAVVEGEEPEERAERGKQLYAHLDPLAADPDALSDGQRRVEVQPKRPQCKHYARQMTDLQDNSDVTMVERLCTMRRDSSGTQFGLRDSQLFACELRSPRDPNSEVLLEVFDDGKVKIGEARMKAEGHDLKTKLDKARTQANEQGLEYGGIFRT